MKTLRVAIVHDWLTSLGGGERVVMALHQAFPKADFYTSVFDKHKLSQFANFRIRTSFLQRLPFAKTHHQLFPTMRPLAFESMDLSQYDVVISTCSAESKGVVTKPSTLHIVYLFTPTRYYWSGYHEYLANPGLGWLSPLVRVIAPVLIHRMRQWDLAAAGRADHIISISQYVAARTSKYYRRESSAVIFPPVSISRFSLNQGSRKGFVVVSRLIPYKRVDLAVQACTELNLPLTVVGVGSEMVALRALAGPTIRFEGRLNDEETARMFGQAEALLFPAEEDFGIVPLEAMACGTPVIAYGKGGALETVIDGTTGLHFPEQNVESLKDALTKFDASRFDARKIRSHAEEFDESIFIEKFRQFVDSNLGNIHKNN